MQILYPSSKWMFSCSLNGHIDTSNCVDCWVYDKMLSHFDHTIQSLLSIHVSFMCPILKPPLTTYHSHRGIWLFKKNQIRDTSHMRLRACDHYTSSTLIGGKAEPVQVCFTLRLTDQHSVWMQDGCKVYMDSCMASNRSCFMVTWTIFKNHLLEVGLTQNQETMTLRTPTTAGLFYFIKWEDPTWIEIHWSSI
jgi:hypothetical protein